MKAARTAASAEKPNAERKWQMVREKADILPLSLLKSRDSGILTAIVFRTLSDLALATKTDK